MTINSISNELKRTIKNKSDIKAAIEYKGVEVPDETIFSDYPEKIDQIKTGGNGYYYNLYKIITINETTASSLFSEREITVNLNLDNLITYSYTDMRFMFEGCTALKSLNVSNWDTSNVTDMVGMFYGCNNLTSIIGTNNWDTSNVTDMSRMFYGCERLKQLDLSSWDTSKVTNMTYMFRDCRLLNVLDIRNFNLSFPYTTQVGGPSDLMFDNCIYLHTVRLDNCNRNTIDLIIKELENGSAGSRSGKTNTIYCKESEATGLTPPNNINTTWVFSYV